MTGISVLILTLNEAVNLPGALASLAGRCDDIVVLDSFSSDATVEIAMAGGARIEQRRFDNYAAQRNAGLALAFRNPWVLMLDADERVDADLWSEMLAAIAAADSETAMFRMRRKDFLLGRWQRRATGYPTWFGRLVRIGRVRVERDINEEYIADGKVGSLRGHLLHYPFNRGVAYWIERHNTYSTLEARRICAERREALRVAGVFSSDPVTRRKALKRIAYRLPFRPLLVFVYLYFIRFGVLDGRAGLMYCRLRAIYERFIDYKIAELAESGPGGGR